VNPASPPRRPARRSLEELRPFVRDGRYRIGPHAARHALTEGFTERDVVMTLLHGRELARYLDDRRLLVLGWLPVSRTVRLPLHVVAEYGRPRWVDVVTAFIPPTRTGWCRGGAWPSWCAPSTVTRPVAGTGAAAATLTAGQGGRGSAGRRKSARALASRRRSRAAGSTPRRRASSAAVWRTYAGRFDRPRCGTGARNGASVSTSRRSIRDRASRPRGWPSPSGR
jgi:hypothetical protein